MKAAAKTAPKTTKTAAKKTVAQKAPAAKPQPKKVPEKKTSQGKTLVKDLSTLLQKLDEPALRFLKQQAEILLANKKFDETRKATIEALERFAASGGRTGKPVAADKVSVEQKQGNFFIVVRDASVFFNLEEMRAITRICHAADGGADGARRLFRWFSKERRDFLIDTGVESPADPALPRLYEKIVTTYKVRS